MVSVYCEGMDKDTAVETEKLNYISRLSDPISMQDVQTLETPAKRKLEPDHRLRHIQGIRAICLIYVLLFHFHLGGATSGFLGVDMFFVISGYVMTKSICSSLFRNTFSLTSFFKSRYWRLYPVLVVTCAVSVLSFSLIFEPAHFYELQKAAVFSMAGLQNVHEMADRFDYFAVGQRNKPLLHLWSLSLEQQFYAIFAVGMMLLHRYTGNAIQHRISFVSAIVVTSLIFIFLSIPLAKRYPSSKFYFLFNRFFEFAFGCVLYLKKQPSWTAPYSKTEDSSLWRLWNELQVTFGLLIPTAQVFEWFPDKDIYKWRVWLLLSVCILIDVSDNKISKALLTNSLVVAVGEASYTIYLLHLPIWNWFELAYYCTKSKDGLLFSVLVSLSILSSFCFWFVEKPFRERKGSYLPGFSVAWLTMFGYLLYQVIEKNSSFSNSSFMNHTVENAKFSIDVRQSVLPVPDSLRISERFSQVLFENGEQIYSRNYSGVDAMIVGDSFALQLSPGVKLASGRLRKKLFVISMLACRFGFQKVGHDQPCATSSKFIWKSVLAVRPKVLFISHRWDTFFGSPKLDNRSKIPPGMSDYFIGLTKNFSRSGVPLVFIGTNPAFDDFLKHKQCVHLQKTRIRSLLENEEARKETYKPGVNSLRPITS